jgi:hypothetical protein
VNKVLEQPAVAQRKVASEAPFSQVLESGRKQKRSIKKSSSRSE